MTTRHHPTGLPRLDWVRLTTVLALVACHVPGFASARAPDAAALLALARERAAPPVMDGVVLDLRYAISRIDRDRETHALNEQRRLSGSDGILRVDVGSKDGGEVRISDGRQLWIELPTRSIAPQQAVLIEALDVAARLRLLPGERVARAKATWQRERRAVEIRLEGAESGKRRFVLDAATGDLFELRETRSGSARTTGYANWRPLGESRVPGQVLVTWGSGGAGAKLVKVSPVAGLPSGTMSPAEEALPGRLAASCESWSAPLAQPAPRLEDLLWDHAPPIRFPERWGPPMASISRGQGSKNYADVAAGSTGEAPSQVDASVSRESSSFSHLDRPFRMKEKRPARARHVTFPAGTRDRREPSEEQLRLAKKELADSRAAAIEALGDHPRPAKKRRPSKWLLLGRVASDGYLTAVRTLQGPVGDRDEDIPPLPHFIDFEPARCDGEAVATWHEFELSWPLPK